MKGSSPPVQQTTSAIEEDITFGAASFSVDEEFITANAVFYLAVMKSSLPLVQCLIQ